MNSASNTAAVDLSEDHVKMVFGWNLRRKINERRLTQAQFAEIIGTSQQHVGKWVTGRTIPDLRWLIKICAALAVSADYLWRDPDAR